MEMTSIWVMFSLDILAASSFYHTAAAEEKP